MVRLALNVGKEHRVGPADIVGVMINLGKLPKAAVGAIHLLPRQSFVDVNQKHVARVLSKLNGIRFKGYELAIRLAASQQVKTGAMEPPGEDLRNILVAMDLADRPAEEPARVRMLELLDGTPECFERTSFSPGHFTGSALVVNADGSRVLLHHHRKLDKWLQFGGHCDGDEDVLRVACREALEESGIEGLIVASQRPFDLDIHEIPARRDDPAHDHYDVRYMLIAPESATPVMSEESRDLRWFTPEECAALELDESLRRMIAKWQAIVAKRAH